MGSLLIPYYNETSTAAWEYAEPFDANNATPGSRKVVLKVQLTGAEIGTRVVLANTYGAQIIPLLVFGY